MVRRLPSNPMNITTLVLAAQLQSKPLKVFILAGESGVGSNGMKLSADKQAAKMDTLTRSEVTVFFMRTIAVN